MIKADLHMHSEHSPDGEWRVHDILTTCKQEGLSVIAITDHNLVKAVPEALDLATEIGIRVIPGIEMDCQYRGIDLHVLGYNIAWQNQCFTDLEDQMAKLIMDSFNQMLKNLRKLGIDADPSEILLKADGRLPSAELIAEVLLENERYADHKKLDAYRPGGNRSDMPYINFYLDFFAQGKPAYVKIDFMDYEDAIAMIRESNGVPVVAHPGHNLKGREEMILELMDHGAEGWEVFNNYHTAEQMTYFADIALKKKVLMTGGSDFHGKTKPLIRPGEYRTLKQFEGYVDESISILVKY